MHNILVLGGTTEATRLVQALADTRLPATLSYAGRVERPRPQPVPVRTGGFGGPEGLARYLSDQGITHLIDATHPFAAQMSTHAVQAAAATGTPLLAYTRPAWVPEHGDDWTLVPDIAAAVSALDGAGARVLLAIGRMHLASFAAQPQHHYLLRLVDPPQSPPPLPDHHIVIDRGPFTVHDDMALLVQHRITRIVSKNAGGTGARAKLVAARQLCLPVIMIDRPTLPARHEATRLDQVLHWLSET